MMRAWGDLLLSVKLKQCLHVGARDSWSNTCSQGVKESVKSVGFVTAQILQIVTMAASEESLPGGQIELSDSSAAGSFVDQDWAGEPPAPGTPECRCSRNGNGRIKKLPVPRNVVAEMNRITVKISRIDLDDNMST